MVLPCAVKKSLFIEKDQIIFHDKMSINLISLILTFQIFMFIFKGFKELPAYGRNWNLLPVLEDCVQFVVCRMIFLTCYQITFIYVWLLAHSWPIEDLGCLQKLFSSSRVYRLVLLQEIMSFGGYWPESDSPPKSRGVGMYTYRHFIGRPMLETSCVSHSLLYHIFLR